MNFESVNIEESISDTSIARKVIKSLKNVEIKNNILKKTHHTRGKNHLTLTSKRGSVMDLCASINKEYICCAAHVLHTVSNCPYSCTYCFLQNYLNNNSLSVIADTKSIIKEVKDKINSQPWRFFRTGTWELGDSLATEPYTQQAKELITAFSRLPNVLLDLRTKSSLVDTLLKLSHNNRTVLSWSLNPQIVISKEEKKTASLQNRLNAITKAFKAGYLISLHFDPVIYYSNWETDYAHLIKQIFETVPVEKITWISIGSLRFNPEMKKKIESNYPESKITTEEMVIGNDNKMRYIKPVRIKMYKQLIKNIKKYSANEKIMIHLCMERWDMWDKIFGSHPKSTAHLDYQFAESLYNRFPILRLEKPDLKKYLQNKYS
ncbi:MAG: hypothetical protein GY730_03200 [bacterium]|nr:hypothetical protein [bacterium]